MIEPNSSVRIVLTTVGSREEASRMGRTLVEEHLAACASSVPGVESIYRWKDLIQTDTEILLILKTETGKLEALQARLHELHSYETPEFLVVQVETGSQRYVEWLNACLERV